jgi:CRP-like cAMP-binding protein
VAKIKPLKQSGLFSSLTDRELALFSRVISENECAPDTVLVTENTKNKKFVFIEKGKVTIHSQGQESNEVCELVGGDTFGEWAILAPDHLTSVSVKVTETSKLLVLTSADFEKFAKDEPGIALKIQKDLIKSAWQSMEELRDILLGDKE